MPARSGWIIGGSVVVLALVTASPAEAAKVRFHYGLADGCALQLRPGGPSNTTAERLTWLGGWEPYDCPPPRPTCVVTFCHSCSGQSVAVPLALPEGTPTIQYRGKTVVYNYGSYAVEVQFQPDGGVTVAYNSGLFRAP